MNAGSAAVGVRAEAGEVAGTAGGCIRGEDTGADAVQLTELGGAVEKRKDGFPADMRPPPGFSDFDSESDMFDE